MLQLLGLLGLGLAMWPLCNMCRQLAAAAAAAADVQSVLPCAVRACLRCTVYFQPLQWVTYNRRFRLGRKGAWWELPLDAKLGLTYSGGHFADWRDC